jgi:hypothetical protein
MVGARQNVILSWFKRFKGGFLTTLKEEYDYFKYGIGYGQIYWISGIFKSSNHLHLHIKSHGIASRLSLLAKDIDHGMDDIPWPLAL